MNIPLDEVIFFDETTADPATGNAADADSTPTFEVFEEATDAAIVSGNFTKRTSKTGDYRGTFTLSTANGFEVGKWYSIIAAATVGGVSGKKVSKNFRVVAAETAAGFPQVDVKKFGGTDGTFFTGFPTVANVIGLVGGIATGGIAAASIDVGALDAIAATILLTPANKLGTDSGNRVYADVRKVNGEDAAPTDSIALSGTGPYEIDESGGTGAGSVAATIDLTLSGSYSAWATDALLFTDGDGDPVEGLTIRAFPKASYNAGSRELVAEVTSDADGRWSPKMDLPSGDFYVTADTRGDGFQLARVGIRIP